MGLNLQFDYGQTPLEPEEMEGLKILSVTTKGELDDFEQQNIEEALLWIKGKKWNVEKILSEAFIMELHRRMYGNVWKWAGHFRISEKNIGVPYFQIGIELRKLLGDILYWKANSIFPPDEIALRFKHRLVTIHCFPNGNGRHSRMMADIIIEKIFSMNIFSWGIYQTAKEKATIRKEYILTLKAADNGDINPLILFARS